MRARRVAFYYFIAGAVWIVGTDALMLAVSDDAARLLSMSKGLLFIAMTTVGLHVVLSRWDKRRLQFETDLKESNQRLRESEADLSAIIDNLPDIFYRTDAAGRILRISRCTQEILGYEAEEMLGRNLADFYVDPAQRQQLLTDMRDKGGTLSRYEIAIRRKDGQTVWCSVNARFTYDANGVVSGVEGLSRDITEHRHLEMELKRLVRFDPLTGLLNRPAFVEKVSLALARARRDQGSVGLLFLDLDGFKEVNDSCGHSVGDQLLQEVAQRLNECLRETDAAGRFGGDEFLLLLEGPLADSGCLAAADRLVGSLRRPFHLCGQQHQISVSIGVAQYPEDGTSAEELLRHADQAMYLAKSGGKNGFRCLASAGYASPSSSGGRPNTSRALP